MGSSPKTPAPSAQEVLLQDQQRLQSDQLTRDKNEQLKSLMRQRSGQQALQGTTPSIMNGLGSAGTRPPVPTGTTGTRAVSVTTGSQPITITRGRKTIMAPTTARAVA